MDRILDRRDHQPAHGYRTDLFLMFARLLDIRETREKKGKKDKNTVQANLFRHASLLSKVKTKKTELLFVTLILRMLKMGGRSATVVPDGVLFGSSKAHVALRKMLVDDNQLEAVISLPSGVFKPYAGVSTGIIVFTKGGQTGDVFYYDVQADGYSLDDKRTEIDDNDLPGLIERWKIGRLPKTGKLTESA